MLRFSSAEATRSFVVQWCRFPNLAFRFCFSNTFICVFDVSRARGYIYDLVPRVVRLLHLLVSPFLTSQQETLSCPRPLCPKISRTEHSILHWSWKLWDAISMWKADLEKELCVLTMFCIQRKVVQTPCVNRFVLEKLVSLWLVSWLFTFGWEPVCFENFWKCFDDFEFI